MHSFHKFSISCRLRHILYDKKQLSHIIRGGAGKFPENQQKYVKYRNEESTTIVGHPNSIVILRKNKFEYYHRS